MDHFGIGTAMRSLVSIYSVSARGTGRTTSLVESLKDGDRVVVVNQAEGRRLERLCAERGVTIKWLVVPPSDPGRLFEHGSLTGAGRNIFDHSWVEAFYAAAIERAAEAIDLMERESSGHRETFRETRRQAEELIRWRGYATR